MKTIIYKSMLSLALISISLIACKNDSATSESKKEAQATATETPSNALSIAALPTQSPEFDKASLSIKNVKTEMIGKDSVKVSIEYAVSNYELKKQTEASTAQECNNSDKGQHIHFIIDNKAYTALYEPTYTFTIPVKSSHYIMSFLSRSYHESLKNKGAGVLLHFSVDEKGVFKKLDNPTTPMLFYSRPKGDYVGKDTKNILLDFYVLNTSLSENGNKVKATINGNTFMIDHWAPQFIQNAPMGSLNVKLELVDKDGKNIVGDNTSAERAIQLATQEPIK